MSATIGAVLAAVCLVAVALPNTAQAATLQFHPGTSGGDPDSISYREQAGERNQLIIDYLNPIEDDPCHLLPTTTLCGLPPQRLIFSDAGAPLILPASEERIETISNCVFVALAATCELTTRVYVDVGQASDTVTFRGDALTEPDWGSVWISGGPGNDRLSGSSSHDGFHLGPGSDRVFGGPGSDTIDSRDGEADTVSCGAGDRDHVDADALDQIAADCELVRIF